MYQNFYGAFVLNHHVVLHAIDANLMAWRRCRGATQTLRNGTQRRALRGDAT